MNLKRTNQANNNVICTINFDFPKIIKVLATLFVNDEGKLDDVIELLKKAFLFSENVVEKEPLVAKVVE